MIFIYILILAISLLFYIQFEGSFSFYMFVFVASYPLIFGAISLYVRNKIKISFENSDIRATKGQKTPVKILISNPTPFPVPNCDITVRYCSEINSQSEVFKIHTPVFPKNKQELTVGVSYCHYGSVSLKIVKIKIFDMLKVVRLKKKISQMASEVRLTVFPDHIPIESNINDYSELGLEAYGYSKVKKGDDPSEVFDIHEYNEGDKISRIHWKLSAKQEEMMVKDYSLPIMNGVLIAVDTFCPGDDKLDPECYDAILDAASAVSFHLAENEIMHTVIWNSDSPEGYREDKVADVDDYMVTIDKLVRNSIGSLKGSLPEILAGMSEGEHKFAHIILCTASFTEKDRQLLADSAYSYRYTVLDASPNAVNDHSDGDMSYISITSSTVSEKLEEITI